MSATQDRVYAAFLEKRSAFAGHLHTRNGVIWSYELELARITQDGVVQMQRYRGEKFSQTTNRHLRGLERAMDDIIQVEYPNALQHRT